MPDDRPNEQRERDERLLQDLRGAPGPHERTLGRLRTARIVLLAMSNAVAVYFGWTLGQVLGWSGGPSAALGAAIGTVLTVALYAATGRDAAGTGGHR